MGATVEFRNGVGMGRLRVVGVLCVGVMVAIVGGLHAAEPTIPLYLYNGNVGVGTETPQRLFHVGGDFQVGLIPTMSVVVTSAGRLGVGTTSPPYLLSVDKAGGGFVASFGSSGGVNNPTLFIQPIEAKNIVYFSQGGSVNGSIGLATSGEERMRVTSSGNVGVGTTTPRSRLDIGGGVFMAGSYTSIGKAHSNNDQLSFNLIAAEDASFFTPAYFGVAGAGGSMIGMSAGGMGDLVFKTMRFGTDGTPKQYNSIPERMRITDGGNVGIGIASPLAPLVVVGPYQSALYKNTIGTFESANYGINQGGGIGIGGRISASDTSVHHFALIGGRKENATEGDTAGSFVIETRVSGGNLSEKLRVTSSGNVGIGTTSPGATLEIATTGAASSVILRNTSAALNSYSEIKFAPFTGTTAASAAIRSMYYQTDASAIEFRTTNTNAEPATRVIIDGAGNVGIGTTSPTKKLSIGSSTISALGFTWNGDNQAKSGIETDHNSGEVRYGAFTNYFPTFYSNNTERMRIDNAGNVGIGTVTPTSKLTVNGDVYGKSFSTPYSFEWTARSEMFPNGSQNQKLYIDLGPIRYWGSLEVTIYDGWSYMRTTGKMTKLYDIGVNIGSPYPSQSRLTESFGHVATQWKLGEVEVGADNRVRIPIYHLASQQNAITVHIKGYATLITRGAEYDFALTIPESSTHPLDIEHVSMALGANQRIGVGTTMPTSKLQVIGTVNATAFVGDGSGLTNVSGGWSSAGTGVFYTDRNVGIGTTNPLAKLVVASSNESLEFTVANTPYNGGVIEYINRNAGGVRPDLNYYLSTGGRFS